MQGRDCYGWLSFRFECLCRQSHAKLLDQSQSPPTSQRGLILALQHFAFGFTTEPTSFSTSLISRDLPAHENRDCLSPRASQKIAIHGIMPISGGRGQYLFFRRTYFFSLFSEFLIFFSPAKQSF